MSSITEKELDLIFPETLVTIAGYEFTLKPFSFAETRIVAIKLKAVLHLFASEVTPSVLAEIYDKAFDGVRDVIAMSLGIKPALVEKFDQRSAVKAVTEIIKINKDFFVEQVEDEVQSLTSLLGMEDNSPSEK